MSPLRLVDEPPALPRLAHEAVADALAGLLDRTPRSDVVARDDRVYRALVVLARVKGENPFRTTHIEIAERAALSGYASERSVGNVVSKALKSLRRAGLIEARTFLSDNGTPGGTEVTLLFDLGDQMRRARLQELVPGTGHYRK